MVQTARENAVGNVKEGTKDIAKKEGKECAKKNKKKTAKRNTDMEKVYGVFEDYIRESPYIDCLWSEKLGYILMQIDAEKKETVESQVIGKPEELCRILLHEMAGDVLQGMESEHTLADADSRERAEVEKRLGPYIEQLGGQYACISI